MKITIDISPEEVKELVTPNPNPQVFYNLTKAWADAFQKSFEDYTKQWAP